MEAKMALTVGVRNSNVFTVGSFQAKTYFAELLRKVEEGASFVITRNGHDIATIQKPKAVKNEKAEKAWQTLMGIATDISLDEIDAWKKEGRR
jgi:antitoxin (DNA-binding transcriptional repressor) of toxin-antitoxin stability system